MEKMYIAKVQTQNTFLELTIPASLQCQIGHILHAMHVRVSCPLSKRLAIVIEWDGKKTPQDHQAHIEHNGGLISVSFRPRCDKLAEAITPDILVHGDGDEDRSSDGLVAVNGVCTGNGWDRRHLYAGASVADNDDWLRQR